jgi:hypothetical protein
MSKIDFTKKVLKKNNFCDHKNFYGKVAKKIIFNLLRYFFLFSEKMQKYNIGHFYRWK